MNFVLAPAAIADLKQISDYFVANNVEAGEKLFQKFQSLTRFLKLGKPYPSLHPEIRFYRVNDQSIEIVRIINARRNLQEIFKNMNQ